MTHPSKRKGSGFELEIIELLRQSGVAALKVPLSGALPDHPGDIDVPVRGVRRLLECKRRRRAFATLYKLLGERYGVVCRDDRTAPLVVMRLADFADLAK